MVNFLSKIDKYAPVLVLLLNISLSNAQEVLPNAEGVVDDEISQISKPLMKKATVNGDDFTFEWNEPNPEFTYTLSIHRGKNPKPIITEVVSGGKKTISLTKDKEPIYWRVSATSSLGKESKDRKKFQVPNSTGETKSKTQFILRAGGHLTNSSYEQKAEDETFSSANETLKLKGPSMTLKGEVWRNKFGFILGLRNESLTASNTDYKETELLGEVGYHWKKFERSSHNLAAGVSYALIKLTFDNSEGEYTRTFATLRHQYERILSPKWAFEMNTTLLQPVQSELVLPSWRLTPALNWYLRPNWWLSIFGGYEKNNANLTYNESGIKGELEVNSNVILYGMTINWKSF